MTGLVEMASVSQWKPILSERNSDIGDIVNENVKPTRNDSSEDIRGIPTWKRELVSKKTTGNENGNRNSYPSSVPVINIEENGTDNVFIDDSVDIRTTQYSKMGSGTQEMKNNPTPSHSSNMGKGNVVTSHLRHVHSNPFFTKSGVLHPHGNVESKDENAEFVQNNRDEAPVVTSHLKHVKSNPFFQDFGQFHPHGKIYNDASSSGSNSPSFQVGDEDDMMNDIDTSKGETGPFSGIVGKRRKMFLQTQLQSNKSINPVRKYASLENLLDIKKSKTDSASSLSPTEKASGRLFSDSSSRESTRTGQNINKTSTYKPEIPKPSRPQKPPIIRSSDSSQEYNKASVKHEHHHLAPDIEMGRDDIIIIEQPKPKPSKPNYSREKQNDLTGSNSLKAFKDVKQDNELPKQNTVSSVRSMFESGSGLRSRLKDIPRAPTLKPPPMAKKVSTSNKKTSEMPRSVESSTDDDRKSSTSASELRVNTETLPSSSQVQTQSTVVNNTDTSVSIINTRPPIKPRILATEDKGMFDSPLTKKREEHEKKSIFDSRVIIPKESPKLQPKVKKENKKKTVKVEDDKSLPLQETNKEDVVETQKSVSQIVAERNLSPTPSSLLVNYEKSRKVETATVPKSSSVSENNEKVEIIDSALHKQSLKSIDSVNLNKTVADKGKSNDDAKSSSSDYFPARKEIFDSSLIVPVSEKSVVEHTKIKPPRPKNKLVKKNSSEDKSDVRNDTVTHNNLINEGKKDISSKTGSNKHVVTENSTNKSIKSAKVQDNFNNEQKENNIPTKGVPSIMLERYKKDNMKMAGDTELYKPQQNNEIDMELLKPSQMKSRFHAGALSSPVPKKRQAPKPPNDSTVLDSSKNNAAVSVKLKPAPGRRNIDDLIGGKRRSAPSAVFDSSNIVPTSKPVINGGLDQSLKLDLSSLNEPVLDHPYQEGYIPTKIQPCTILFKGADIKFEQNPLKKTRSNQQLKITFDDNAKTHEYLREDDALKDYLEDNPHEAEDAERDREGRGDDLDKESLSDDIDVTPQTPREESTIKSNTPLGHAAGELVNYKSKMQIDYQFGMVLQEPEPAKEPEPVPQQDPDDMELRPAAEDDLANWSESSTSDLLF